jgi:thiosulfate dehydrogenase [quinone] large subunit
VLLPLRAFLGVTFVYAGVSKLLDRHYLDPLSPLGVHAQMLHAAASSPIGALVTMSARHATLTGLTIAFGEMAVGLGTLMGLFARLAAAGGALLALSFFLTVSWSTRPYYYGADIGDVFAWLPLVVAGDGGLFSLGASLRSGVRRQLHLPPRPTLHESALVRNEVDRRTVLRGGVVAAAVGAVTVAAGTVVALARRPSAAGSISSRASSGDGVSSARSAGGSPIVIAPASAVPVGSAKTFTTTDGQQAYLLHPAVDAVVAFHATCTPQGCPVAFVGPGFRCPCHGASYDANGQVTGGPAPRPLAKIPVTIVDGQVTTA